MEKKLCTSSTRIDDKDHISELPDDILTTILSSLTMREAIRTSVLSRRWENLWHFYTGFMDLDSHDKTARKLSRSVGSYNTALQEKEMLGYMNWVNRVLDSHQGGTIDGFRLSFDMGSNQTTLINKCINFAIKKRVHMLELDLSSFSSTWREKWSYAYTFREGLLDLSPGTTYKSFDNLTVLRLHFVNVTDGTISHFLSNCPLLEELSLIGILSLASLTVTGPALKLQRLEISECYMLSDCKISAKELLSCKYHSDSSLSPFEYVPLVRDLSIGGQFCRLNLMNLDQLSFRWSQLLTLTLELEPFIIGTTGEDYTIIPEKVPEFSNLKKMVLRAVAFTDQSLLNLYSLVYASPHLETLVVKLKFRKREYQYHWIHGQYYWIHGFKQQPWPNNPHQGLKVLEILGWQGVESDFELVIYLIENAVQLEKVIIDCRHQIFTHTLKEFAELDENIEAAARKRAKHLQEKLPPGVELVIF